MARETVHRQFPETQWSIVIDARDLDPQTRADALEKLFNAYLPALRAHLILRKRFPRDQADDFLQDFVLKKIIEQNIVSKADTERGRFRSFILKALDNFVRDYFRTNKKQNQLSEAEEESLAEGHETQNPDVFETAWAHQVFNQAITLFKQECKDAERDAHWIVFQERLLAPVVSREASDDYESLARKCNFESPKQARNALINAKRIFSRCLRTVIEDYIAEDQNVEDEIRDLINILKKSTSLDGVLGEFFKADSKVQHDNFGTFASVSMSQLIEDPDDTGQWTSTELRQMWLQILNTPFKGLDNDTDTKVDTKTGKRAAKVKDILFASKPHIDRLQKIRKYAKSEYSEEDTMETFPCYFVLYITAIAVAIYKCGKQISNLPITQLRKNLEFALNCSWIDPVTRENLQIAKKIL